MRPSIWFEYFNGLSFREKIKAFKESGFDCAELSCEAAEEMVENPSLVTEYKKIMQSEGFEFPQGHLEFTAVTSLCTLDITSSVDRLKRNVDIFLELGIKDAVIHRKYGRFETAAGKIHPFYEQQLEALSRLSEYVKNEDFCFCVENLGGDSDAGEILKLIKEAGGSKLGICLDTGHLHMNGGSQYAFILQAGAYLKALHIQDGMGINDDHMMPYGKGTINWDEFLKGLKEINFDGLFNFEIPGETYCVPVELRIEKARYVLKIYEYMINRMKSF